MSITKIVNYLVHKDKYKIIYILLVVGALYGYYILGMNEDNAIDSILLTFQFEMFNILFFIITFLTSMFVVEHFNNEFKDVIIRLENKKKYILKLVLINIIIYFYNLFLFGIIFFSLVFVTKIGTTKIILYESYNINSLVYLFYYLIRYFLLLLNFNIISVYIFLAFGKIKTGLFQIII